MRRLITACCALGLLLPAAVLLMPGVPVALANPTSVSGLVYRDYNDNGVRDTREPPVPGITVRAFIVAVPNGPESVGATATTASDGTYTLSVPVAAGTSVRVEFDVPAGGFQSSSFGASSATTAQFVTTPAANVNLGILRPGQYCQDAAQLRLTTSCYAFGNPSGPDPLRPGNDNPIVMYDFPYTAGAAPGSASAAYDAPTTHTLEPRSSAIGTTWGLAYQRSTRTLFAGAFMKRHAGFGPNGPGAIYRLNPAAADGAPSLWLDLNAAFPGAAGTSPRGATPDYFVDAAAWDAVGKVGLGDVEMFEDDRTLYVIALGDRRMYQIPVGADGSAPAAAAIRAFSLPEPAGAIACTRDPATPAGELNLNLRPFGLGQNDGLVYVGMVCTAQSTQVATELRAYVYAFDPATNTFATTPAVTFPLAFPRGCISLGAGCETSTSGQWRPWLQNYSQVTLSPSGVYMNVVAPQAWLTAIDFDNGAMILGFRDRNGDQVGNVVSPPGGLTVPGQFHVGLAGGDTMRACPSGAGTWAIEGTAGCATNGPTGRTTPPEADEFFFQDDHDFHSETGAGGILQVPGLPDTTVLTNDPVFGGGETFDGGARWYSNTAGTVSRIYRLYNSSNSEVPPLRFGKSNGLGDLEALCDPAPVEIGNRVWFDVNQDGVQNPGELPVPGVTLRLYNEAGQVVATAVTNASGEYYFRGGPPTGDATPGDFIGQLAGPVGFNTRYQIRIDNPADFGPTGPLNGWFLTYNDRGTSRVRDSNGLWQSTTPGTAQGYTFADVLTGTAGNNNHTFDFGFIQNPTRIRLSSFTADRIDAGIEVSWVTSAEVNTWGFRLLRSASGDRADAVVVTPQMIAAQGRGGTGATYVWLDTSVQPGTAYSYWLQEIELNGTATEYGPASATGVASTRQRFYLPLLWR